MATLVNGKALFNDQKLGTTGATCNSDLHGSAATFPKFKPWAGKEVTLAEMSNGCITMTRAGFPS